MTPIIAGAGFSFLLFLTILIFYRKKVGRQRAENRDLTDQEEYNFIYGDKSSSAANEYHYLAFAQGFNHKFILSSQQLREGTNKLGSGAFRVVNEGFLKLSEDSEELRVAIKSVRYHANVQYFLALLSEVKIMAYLAQHENIVQLYGAWIDSIKSCKIAIAVEYCAKGDLLKVLRKTPGSNMARTEAFLFHCWAWDVARGLEYIGSKNVIHGDLVTRNVLITAGQCSQNQRLRTFEGGSELWIHLYQAIKGFIDCCAIFATQAPLPWKWLASKSLESLKFSTQSGIWSYGVLLSEIFSLGAEPYVGMKYGPEFLGSIKNELRLERSGLAREDVYQMILKCWETNPNDRLNLTEACEALS